MSNKGNIFLQPLIDKNPITLQILGLCSALAVTTRMETALVMAVAVIFVVSCSNMAVSAIRTYIPLVNPHHRPDDHNLLAGDRCRSSDEVLRL